LIPNFKEYATDIKLKSPSPVIETRSGERRLRKERKRASKHLAALPLPHTPLAAGTHRKYENNLV